MANAEFKIELDTSDIDVALEKAAKLKAELQEINALKSGAAGSALTDAQIKHMAEQFLRWKLPENFNPDGGIAFHPVANEGSAFQYRREPVGTNLFDYTQAEAMVRHMLDGLPGI